MSPVVAAWMSLACTVAMVALLEVLLGVDNALILALLVRHLPAGQQRRALRYGILGAFGLRFAAVLLATRLLHFWAFAVVGGGYLLALAANRLAGARRGSGSAIGPRAGSGQWGTVLRVELADLAFSIDSVLAAVGVAQALPGWLRAATIGGATVAQWVTFAGGALGILTMRYLAGWVLVLLNRFRGLSRCADFLVAWIGVKLVGEGLRRALTRAAASSGHGWRNLIPEWAIGLLAMPAWLFWAGMLLIPAIALWADHGRASRGPAEPAREASGVTRAPGPGTATSRT
jgi:YkoY family integral membrane protein